MNIRNTLSVLSPFGARPVLRAGLMLGLLASGLLAQAPKLEEETIVLSPFEVSTSRDGRYRAANSTSASLINQPIIESAFNIAAITNELMADLALVDLGDLKKYSSGLDQAQGGTGFGTEFNSRGFSATTLNNGHRSRQFQDSALIDRIEVVKGPMGTLYGESGGGGVVNIGYKQAQLAKSAMAVSLGLGEYGYRRAVLDVNAPFTAFGRNAAIRAIGYSSETESPIMWWYEKKRGAYAAISVQPVKAVTVAGRGDILRYDRPNSQAGNIVRNARRDPVTNLYVIDFPNNAGLGTTWNAIGPDGKFNWTQYTSSGEITVTFNPNLIARFSGMYMDQFLDAADGWRNENVVSRSAKRIDYYDRERDTVSAKGDLLYQWEAAKARLGGQLIFGTEYYRNTDREVRLAYTLPIASYRPVPNPATGTAVATDFYMPPQGTVQTVGSFTAGSSRLYSDNASRTRSSRVTALIDTFGKRLRWIAGYRRNNGHFKANNANVIGSPYTKVPFSQATYQYGVSGDVIKNTAQEAVVSQVSPYFTYGTTFIPPRQGNTPDRPQVQPETGAGWDLGIKFELYRGKIAGSASVFKLKRDKFLNNVYPIDGGPSYFINSGQQEADGYEFELTAAPTREWESTFQFSHVKGETTVNLETPALVGLQLPFPSNRLTWWGQYNVTRGPLRDLSLGLGYSFTGSIQAHSNRLADQGYRLPWYALWSARLGYKCAPWGYKLNLGLNVDNLADRLYVTRSEGGQFLTGAPRTIRLSATFNF